MIGNGNHARHKLMNNNIVLLRYTITWWSTHKSKRHLPSQCDFQDSLFISHSKHHSDQRLVGLLRHLQRRNPLEVAYDTSWSPVSARTSRENATTSVPFERLVRKQISTVEAKMHRSPWSLGKIQAIAKIGQLWGKFLSRAQSSLPTAILSVLHPNKAILTILGR